jgi:PRC-barrel domain protein
MAVARPDHRGWPCSTRDLVGMRVRIGDVVVGRIVDVLLNRSLGHVLGFVVEGRGAHRHFLPWVAGTVEDGHVVTLSVFALLSTSELAFYLDNGLPLREVLGAPPDGNRILEDVLVDRDGDVVSLVHRPSGANGSRAHSAREAAAS